MADSTFVLYHYNPSLAAAIIFIFLFLVVTIVHIVRLAKNKTWYFIPFIIGGFFEFIGYAGRAESAHQSPNWTTGPYICQSLLLLLAPSLFAASIYMILGRTIRLTDGDVHSIIHSKWLTKIFVLGDVLSFFAQSGGGGMLATAKTQSSLKLGNNVIIGGLIIQVIYFGFFMTVATIWHIRMTRAPTPCSMMVTVPWQKFIMILYVASIFIMVRSAFRVAEYVQGTNGSLQKTEVYLYIFYACLMFITMTIFAVYHPSSVINKETLGKHYVVPDEESIDTRYMMSNFK